MRGVPRGLPLLLGLLTAVGPVSTDMYLPAFPRLEADLGHVAGGAQITLAAWFAGLAFGQIAQGSLSDRFGRRAPLLAGMALYTLASAGCAIAASLAGFSLFRVLAAWGGSAGMVIPRAMVRDLADGPQAARLLSRLMLVMGVVPVLAPAAGGLALEVFGSWRFIFWLAAAYGLASTLLVALFLPDTLAPARRVRVGPLDLLRRYGAIARERQFLTSALCNAFGISGIFAYLAGSPDAFLTTHHVRPPVYGMLFGLNAAGYILAAQFNARLLIRFGTDRVIRAMSRIAFAATLILTIDAVSGWGGVAGLAGPLFLYLATMGILLPAATVAALSPHAAHAASASALMGSGQFVCGAIAGGLVGALADGSPRPMAFVMLGLAAALLWAERRRPRSG
jgi:DHA1 family bicyclomycin/chloramphenicol resistance-like MFS transporter